MHIRAGAQDRDHTGQGLRDADVCSDGFPPDTCSDEGPALSNRKVNEHSQQEMAKLGSGRRNNFTTREK